MRAYPILFLKSFLSVAFVLSLDCPKGTVIEISGAGSFLPAEYYFDVSQMYALERATVGISVKLNYEAISGGFGKESIANQLVMFAASEALLTLEEEVKLQKIKTFPLLAGAVVMIAYIPKVNVSALQIKFTDVPKIYMGDIRYWNDPSIQSVNPNVVLPNQLILPVAYGDNTGLTEVFTQTLSVIDNKWKANYGTFTTPDFIGGLCCNSTRWPSFVRFYGNTVTGVLGVVSSIPYTIGFIGVGSVKQYPEFILDILGPNNTPLPPTKASVQNAMDYWTERSDGVLTFPITNAPNGYPIAALSYVFVNASTTSGFTCCQMRELVGFLEYSLVGPTDDIADEYGLVQLSTKLAMQVEQVLKSITCEGDNVYDMYQASLKVSSELTTAQIVGIVIAITGATVIIGAICVVCFCIRKLADESKWYIESTGLKAVDDMHDVLVSTPHSSSNSEASQVSASNSDLMHLAPLKFPMSRGTLDDRVLLMVSLPGLTNPRRWHDHTKRLVAKLRRDFTHEGLATFLGVTQFKEVPYTLSLCAKKGTLHYVLQTSPYDLQVVTKYNYSLDVADAMDYLHKRNIVHGHLNSITCYIDRSWALKVCQWERLAVMESENKEAFLEILRGLVTMTEHVQHKLIKGLYVDPEALLDGHAKKQNDVYSFGLLLVEIFTRKLPFHENVAKHSLNAASYEEVLMSKARNQESMLLLPADMRSDLRSTINSCLSHPTGNRPSFQTLISQLRSQNPSSLGIVDVMMDSMEDHVKQLESTSKELNRVTKKMQELLNEVLPPSIARKMFNNEKVEPEHFDCVTVCFADVCGFTSMSMELSPLQVMTFLNDLWVAFDGVLDQYDVYKADTVADTYMVCSGLPERNGNDHLKEIARMSLSLIEVSTKFRIPGRPGEMVKIRIGINSGPVTTGVVGTKMPQYCVFGDTVNTASRMESTSLPCKCQISSHTFELLQQYHPQFKTEPRGELEVKGKGTMRTHWLLYEERLDGRGPSRRVRLNPDAD